MLTELHSGHQGVSRTKSLPSGLVWWPGLDASIETMVKHCGNCQQNQSSPPSAPKQLWSWPTRPWSRLHVDYAGPIDGNMLLVVIDAHSKWMEVFPLKTASALTTIQQLRRLFAQFGFPNTIVSDNGPQFAAAEFRRLNGIKHTRVAPYHPSSNGLAERAVRIVKEGLRKQSGGTLSDKLARLLFQYRITPQTTTGIAPAELLLGRKPRSRLDILKPTVEDRVERKQQQQQKTGHDKRSRVRQFTIGEQVFVRNHAQGDKWLPGTITETSGPLSFRVHIENGRTMRCHQDHLRKRGEVDITQTQESSEDDSDVFLDPGGNATATQAEGNTEPPRPDVVRPKPNLET